MKNLNSQRKQVMSLHQGLLAFLQFLPACNSKEEVPEHQESGKFLAEGFTAVKDARGSLRPLLHLIRYMIYLFHSLHRSMSADLVPGPGERKKEITFVPTILSLKPLL